MYSVNWNFYHEKASSGNYALTYELDFIAPDVSLI